MFPAVTTHKKKKDEKTPQKNTEGLDLFESDYLIHFLLFSETLKEMQRLRARAARRKKEHTPLCRNIPPVGFYLLKRIRVSLTST